jgi:hypothetical protein
MKGHLRTTVLSDVPITCVVPVSTNLKYKLCTLHKQPTWKSACFDLLSIAVFKSALLCVLLSERPV